MSRKKVEDPVLDESAMAILCRIENMAGEKLDYTYPVEAFYLGPCGHKPKCFPSGKKSREDTCTARSDYKAGIPESPRKYYNNRWLRNLTCSRIVCRTVQAEPLYAYKSKQRVSTKSKQPHLLLLICQGCKHVLHGYQEIRLSEIGGKPGRKKKVQDNSKEKTTEEKGDT
tara:strand:+ start:113 stop:622 length:510 start_codon:yes stop_codon:yes gene_type:complete